LVETGRFAPPNDLRRRGVGRLVAKNQRPKQQTENYSVEEEELALLVIKESSSDTSDICERMSEKDATIVSGDRNPRATLKMPLSGEAVRDSRTHHEQGGRSS